MSAKKSRHEVFVDDLKAATQHCSEHNWEFTDIHTHDQCVNFTWRRKTTRNFTLCVTEDYPENTVLTDLEASHDPTFKSGSVLQILTTLREGMIASEDAETHRKEGTLKNQEGMEYCSDAGAMSDEDDYEDYDYYNDDSNFDHPEDCPSSNRSLNPLLAEDIASYEEVYGPNSLATRHLESIQEIDLDLQIRVTFLTESIASAWALNYHEPITVRLHMNSVAYLDSACPPSIEVFQVSKKEKVCVLQQLKKILEKFVMEAWHRLGMCNELVARQKALFASERQRQQRERTVDEDTNLARMMDMGIDQAVAMECLQECNGDVALAVNLALNMDITGAWGTKQEWEQQSPDNTEARKSRGFEYRRAVLPEDRVPLSKDDEAVLEIQKPPALNCGFLVQVAAYVEKRLMTLNEFCVVCDCPHVFARRAILKPAVCARELCVFSFQTLGVMVDAANDIAVGQEVISLLLALTKFAAMSGRQQKILDPYPVVVNPSNPQELAIHPQNKDFDFVNTVLSHLTMSDMLQWHGMELKKNLDERHPLAYPLLQWIIASNRSHIELLPPEHQLKFMLTPHQFLLMSSPPAKEAKFLAAKAQHGSVFAFHGSSIENWHGIIRDGLVVASGTVKQVNGAAYGRGIYLSPLTNISLGYCTTYFSMKRNGKMVKSQHKTEQKTDTLDSYTKMTCIALCEVIDCPESLTRHGDIWVCTKADYVCTRFFFVYVDGVSPNLNGVNISCTQHKEHVINALKYKL